MIDNSKKLKLKNKSPAKYRTRDLFHGKRATATRSSH